MSRRKPPFLGLVVSGNGDHLPIGKSLPVKVTTQLGPFSADEIAVQVRYGELDVTGQIHGAKVNRLLRGQPSSQSGVYEFEGELETACAGNFGFSVRLVPVIHGTPEVDIPGLITWWE